MGISVFTLIGHAFYDKNLTDGYVRRGKGAGIAVLFIVALIMSAVTAVKIFTGFSTLSDADVSRFSDNVPEVVISGGEIVSDAPVFKQIDLPNGLTLTIDTQSDGTGAQPLNAGLYVYKKTFVFVDTNQKIQTVPLQNIFGDKPLSVTPQSVRTFLTEFIPYAVKILPVLMFFVMAPMFFMKLVLVTYLLAMLSYVASWGLNVAFSFDARMRLGTLCVIPAVLCSSALNLFSYRFFGGLTTELLIAFAYLLFFMWPVSAREPKTDLE